ncbi:MAG: hypothetical protein JNL90_12635 [Planctomycetes bacterium]|nr:hypothetical protein [Planctomycetota bacterium]
MDIKLQRGPGAEAPRCSARTVSGSFCTAPPTRGSSLCCFHNQSPEFTALRARARGKGIKRERVLVHANEPLPLNFESIEQLREFEKAVLKRLLLGALEPSTARAAVDLGRAIFEGNAKAVRPSSALASKLAAVFAEPPGSAAQDAEDAEDAAGVDASSTFAMRGTA